MCIKIPIRWVYFIVYRYIHIVYISDAYKMTNKMCISLYKDIQVYRYMCDVYLKICKICVYFISDQTHVYGEIFWCVIYMYIYVIYMCIYIYMNIYIYGCRKTDGGSIHTCDMNRIVCATGLLHVCHMICMSMRICVWMCVYMCGYAHMCMNVCVYVCVKMCVYVYVQTRACVHVYAFVYCVHVRVIVCSCVFMCIHMCMCECVCVCMCVCICVRVCMCVPARVSVRACLQMHKRAL